MKAFDFEVMFLMINMNLIKKYGNAHGNYILGMEINRNSSGLTAADRGPGDPSLTQDHTTRTDITAIFNASIRRDFGDNYLKFWEGLHESNQK